MSTFRDLYNADIARYGGNVELYMKVFHLLHRRAATTTFVPMQLLYKALFRMWANRRGIEMTANDGISGGFILGMLIILPLIAKLYWVEIVIFTKGL